MRAIASTQAYEIGLQGGKNFAADRLPHNAPYYASPLIMAGVPPMVVAKNLGRSDTRMVEKHYGHLAPSFVADTIRKLAPEFGMVEKTNIEPLQS